MTNNMTESKKERRKERLFKKERIAGIGSERRASASSHSNNKTQSLSDFGHI